MKYAVLHFSYSAPVRVSITDEARFSAARTTDAAALRADDAVPREDAAPDVRAGVRAVPLRAGVVAVRADVVREFALGDVAVRADAVGAVVRVDIAAAGVVVPRDVATARAPAVFVPRATVLESRTAARVAPVHRPNIVIKAKTFLILVKMLANFAKSGQAKYHASD